MDNKQVLEFMKKWTSEDTEKTLRVHVTHFDLDGYGCLLMSDYWCVREVKGSFNVSDLDSFSPERIREISYGYRETSTIIADYKTYNGNLDQATEIIASLNAVQGGTVLLLISDFSFAEDDIKTLLTKFENLEVCVVDHHQTCPDYGVMDRFCYLKDTSKCATMLLFDCLSELSRDMDLFVPTYQYEMHKKIAAAVNEYDLGRFGEWRVDEYCDVSRQMRLNLGFNYLRSRSLKRGEDLNLTLEYLSEYAQQTVGGTLFDTPTRIQYVLDTVNKISEEKWSEMTNEYERYIRTMIPFNFPGIDECGVMIPKAGKNFFSIAKAVMEDHPEIPYVVGLYMEGFTISLCAVREDINMGLAAKEFGGGGHPGAAGCSFYRVNFIFNVNGEHRTIQVNNPNNEVISEDEDIMRMTLEEIRNGNKKKIG